jgi:hypothetical protein
MAWSDIQSMITYCQDEEPLTPVIGEIWFDTINNAAKCWVNKEPGNETPHWRDIITYNIPE